MNERPPIRTEGCGVGCRVADHEGSFKLQASRAPHHDERSNTNAPSSPSGSSMYRVQKAQRPPTSIGQTQMQKQPQTTTLLSSLPPTRLQLPHPTMPPVTTSDSRQNLLCDSCSTTIDDAPLIHLLHNCSHLFHLDCLIDGVFARLRCPICSSTIERAEMAQDHCSPFVRMSLEDIFEEGVMRANRRRLRAK